MHNQQDSTHNEKPINPHHASDPTQKPKEEDVIHERVDHLIEHRVPWLFVGLLGGFLTTLVVSHYEKVLSMDVRLAFFIPIIVYLSGAVGMQTETIYIRALSKKCRINILKYTLKESVVGLGLGLISGLLLFIIASYWLKSPAIGLVIGLAMFINLSFAPLLAVIITSIFYKEHTDPALGAGPVATILQDLISLIIYFLVASIILF